MLILIILNMSLLILEFGRPMLVEVMSVKELNEPSSLLFPQWSLYMKRVRAGAIKEFCKHEYGMFFISNLIIYILTNTFR